MLSGKETLFISRKMTSYLDSKSLGLTSQTVVEEISKNTLAIVIKRKSRLIMADGRKILAKAAKIQEAKPGCRIKLKTTAPVCSKTLKFLGDRGIEVVRV